MEEKDEEIDFALCLSESWKNNIPFWISEDIPSFDYGGAIVGKRAVTAHILCKTPGILAGKPFVDEIFAYLNCSIEWNMPEGAWVEPITHVATILGPANAILQGERLALNILARASGIATRTHIVLKLSKNVMVAATRKTTPGFRIIEKYAIMIGGGHPHRHDLSSMILIKDNHIDICGGIPNAMKKAKKLAGHTLKIEVECRSLKDAMEALQCGADIVMLDNAAPHLATSWAATIKESFPNAVVEVSGGITSDTISQYVSFSSDDHAMTISSNIDIISMGSLIQGAPVIDFSLCISKN